VREARFSSGVAWAENKFESKANKPARIATRWRAMAVRVRGFNDLESPYNIVLMRTFSGLSRSSSWVLNGPVPEDRAGRDVHVKTE
jgi:hypothetical protein